MMATKQRASGGSVAKTCPKCGAELWDDGSCLPCDWRRVPGQPARPSGEQPSDQPGDWRRWATGTTAFALTILALIALADAASCDPTALLDCWASAQLRYAAYSVLVIASPFALATMLPFGTFRRMTVAVGSAMLIASATIVAPVLFAADDLSPTHVLSAGFIAFCLTLYPAYRLAR